MKWKKVSIFFLVIITIVNIAGSTVVLAEEPEFGIEGAGILAIDISGLEDGKYYDDSIKSDYIQTADNIKTKTTGGYEVKEGLLSVEYNAEVDSIPSYLDGNPINCSWSYDGKAYLSGNNFFVATVTGTGVRIEQNGEYLDWNPKLFLNEVEEGVVSEEPTLLEQDPINSYYSDNTLEWDYGICVRRARIIEGVFAETWVFREDPKGTVEIQLNKDQSVGYSGDVPAYAEDGDNRPLAIIEDPTTGDKTVDAEILTKATYPVIIDPSSNYYCSSQDGYITSGNRSATSGSVTNTSTTMAVGNFLGTWERSYLHYNTSGLPDQDITITACNLTIWCKGDLTGNGDFSYVIQNGQPTYPHNPLIGGDFDMAQYSGNGGESNTSTWTNNTSIKIPMNATGLGWINTNSDTKLMLRSSFDINNITTSTVYQFYAYEQGGGTYKSYLDITYSLTANISNTPSAKNFGVVAQNASYWTSGSAPVFPMDDSECYFTVTNNGNQASITINATDFTGGSGWTLTSGSVGENTVRLKAGKSGDANEGAMITLNSSPQSFISGLATSATKKWELKLETGTFTDGTIKTCTIQLVATLD